MLEPLTHEAPLAGLRVIEFAGLGPVPLCGMLLADLGADVITIDRSPRPAELPYVNRRGRRSIILDLKDARGVEIARRLIGTADALIEGYRPGVMERLGLGPVDVLASHKRLVYGRVTGWGRSGPMADRAGHDINYLALAGVLHSLGPADGPPTPPQNLLGDFGGGALFLALGTVVALWRATRDGRGQVVDATMVDGAALMATSLFELQARSLWEDRRGAGVVGSAAPFYGTYVCSDGRYLAVGAVEPEFSREFRRVLGLGEDAAADWYDVAHWPALKQRVSEIVRERPLDEWMVRFEGVDACVAPVLTMNEAMSHPHNVHRGTFCDVGGVVQPSPSPRFSRTAAATPQAGSAVGADFEELLSSLGNTPEEIRSLIDRGVVKAPAGTIPAPGNVAHHDARHHRSVHDGRPAE